MASKNENNASVPTSASNTPIALDDDESPVETNSDPSVLPITIRHTSTMWSDFKRKRVGDVVKAECNHCSKLLAGGSKAGTTHLKDHLKICPKRTLAPYEFHQEDGRRDLAEMIILHEYPISMVEHMGFRKYSKTLQPGFKVSSRNTTRKDIMKRYELEKENVATLLRKTKGKISLTTDMWTADNQRKGYMAVFICPRPSYYRGSADALKESIQSWNLDLRLSSITVDNCSTNDAMMEILKGVFPYGSLLLRGTNYPTANLYFPKICALRIAISGWLLSPHDYVRKMADIMLHKYNKYWASVNGLMGVATILDPRYKMALIRFYFAKFFDEHDFEIEVGRISDLLRRLVDEYGSKIGKTQGSSSQQPFDLGSSSKANEETFMQEFAEFLQQDKDPNCGEFKDDEYAKLVGELEEGFETWDIDSGTSGVCTE
uniref:BED-type domain-containing protein n=1 Tax=Chenopodium quinoa TaxID=63459 RepID=A0A803LFS5_CHEQI